MHADFPDFHIGHLLQIAGAIMWRTGHLSLGLSLARDKFRSQVLFHSLPRSNQIRSSNPISRHLVWGAAFTVGTFTLCAIHDRRHHSTIRSGRSTWSESKEIWEGRRRRLPGQEPMLLEIEHESLLDHIRRRINSMSDASKLLGVITAANVAVFCLWQIPVPAIRNFMKTWFISDPQSRRLFPHLLSGFSHRTSLHLIFNMVALWSFGSPVGESYGAEQFGFVFGSALVISSIASHMYAVRVGRVKPSLGASGGVLAIISMFTFLHPDRRLILMFLPFVSFPAWAGLAGIAAFDSFGLMLGWQTFDHAAHLGGMLFGYLYSAKLQSWTWDHRQKITDAFGISPRPTRT